jgi:acetate kinase
MNILVMNPGGNSLKVEVVACSTSQQFAFEGEKLVSVILEGIGKKPCLSIQQGKQVMQTQSMPARDYAEAAASILSWLEQEKRITARDIDVVGVRVVHGGREFTRAVKVTPEVNKQIRSFERLAPLHNRSSVELLETLQSRLAARAIYAVFDTAFHHTIPEIASLYPIPTGLSEKHGIRRFGFHGTSHRYLMERSAYLLGKRAEELNLVTLHLESGCSASAIARGKSIDNTMGFTPLEGLMMGSRSGDVDPALVEFLMREEQMNVDDVMTLLNKKSGLLGVSGKSLDTRILMKEYGKVVPVTLAIDMFAYRVVKAVGACLSALGGADAVVFGGGIGENNQVIRERVCESLRWCGLVMDPEKNRTLIDAEGMLTTEGSQVKALVVVAEEGLQIAHECCQAMASQA